MIDAQNVMQTIVDGMAKAAKDERSKTQMTLGALIARLEAMPESLQVQGLTDPHSYRGYYSDLAFETCNTTTSVGVLLKQCRGAMGKEYQGYKGGEFMMGESTPVWVAGYGYCGQKLMQIEADGKLQLAEETY